MSTPKEIARQRLYRSKMMKLSLKDFNVIPAERTAVTNPHCRTQKKTLYSIHVKDHDSTNPFQIQQGKDVSKQRPIKGKIKPEPFIMDDVKTVCDVHGLFYKYIGGRPVRSQKDHKKYITQVRTILLNKADIGYAKDQIMRIDEAIKCNELGSWNEILQHIKKADEYFRLFLEIDFKKVERCWKKTEYMAKQVNEVNDNYAAIASDYAKLKNQIFAFYTKYEILSIYARFLQKVAPPWWRAKYDNNYEEESTFLKNLFLDEKLSQDDITGALSGNLKNNYLYFNTPDQLQTLLENMANQCVTYMKIHTMAKKALHPLYTAGTKYKAQVQFEADRLQYLISTFVNLIAR